jgi:glutaminyl-peptide cyclotransferase
MRLPLLFAATALLFIACKDKEDTGGGQPDPAAVPAPQNIFWNVVNVYPHDSTAFTQGLVFHNNALYEGTGIEGKSTLRKVELKTGKPEKNLALDKTLFGEGITIFKDKIYQLTWKNQLVLVYNLADFSLVKKLNWPKEGWGITHDGTHLIVSDGSSNLYFVDPETFNIMKTIAVKNDKGAVEALNELEYINGFIYANVWQTDEIIQIDPASGLVKGRVDFSGLLQKYSKENLQQTKYYDQSAVLNGIAYDSTGKRLFITGKLWPNIFEVKL